MKICPNLSIPDVKARWDALLNDPELGKIEAMREFIEAEKQDREIGTPVEVKAKLQERFRKSNDVEQEVRINKDREELVTKSFDPTFDDVDTIMGQSVLIDPVAFSTIDTNQSKAKAIIEQLSTQTGVDVEFVSPEEAVNITINTQNPYVISDKKPGFFYNGKIYFVKGAVTTETAFHEFAHPIIRTVQSQNPALFQKLFEEALVQDPNIMDSVRLEYKDFNESIERAEEGVVKNAMTETYNKLIAEEVLVKILTKAAVLKNNNLELPSSFKKLVDDLLYSIKQALRKVFGQKINIARLDVDTTISTLADMLVAGSNFNVQTNNEDYTDVVAYHGNISDYIEDLNKVIAATKNENLQKLVSEMYDGALKQVNMIRRNKNRSEMLELFADEYNRGDLQEIRSNLAKYAKELETKTDGLAEDIEKTRSETQALVNSMLRLELMMSKMDTHLKELVKQPETKDTLHKAHSYTKLITYWQKYIAEAQSMMNQGGASNSSMGELLSRIQTSITNSATSITQMSQKGVADGLWEEWAPVAERANILFKESVKSLTDRGASEEAINIAYKDFYGMTKLQFEKFQNLKALKEAGNLKNYDDIVALESLEKMTEAGKQMTQDKLQKALMGEGKDAHWTNSYLEGYLYNTDPVIGGFAMYFKNNMAEMEARAQSRLSDIQKDLKKVIDDAGLKFNKIGELGTLIGFVDNIGIYNKDTELLDKKEVWTLLNPYKDYRYAIDKFDQDLKDLRNRYNKTGSAEDKSILADMVASKAKHMRENFQQEYVDSFYGKDDILEKDKIGIDAAFARKDILSRMNDLVHPLTNEYDVLKASDEIDALWKEYRLLYSLYHADGTKKTDSFVDFAGEIVVTNDLAMAIRLQEHREATRDYYEFKERPGVFQGALKNFEAETYDKLVVQKYTPGTPEFDDLLNTYKAEWIKRNTRISIKPEFYAKRTSILDGIKAITSKLPSSIANELDFTEHWKTILDVVSGYRDDNGQPKGNDISEGRKSKVKDAQEAVEAAKAYWAGFSGLTAVEMDTMMSLIAKSKGGLTVAEKESLKQLKEKQKADGLDDIEKAELNGLFAALKELQRKDPTEYYVDSINYWLDTIADDTVYKELGSTHVDAATVDKIFTPKILRSLFAKSPDFKIWFEKNHIEKAFFSKDAEGKVFKDTTYERLYVWNVVKPNDPAYYESTQITNSDGTTETIAGLPSLKYYARVVKKKFRTGYDKATGEVNPIIGLHKDNRGEFLPKEGNTTYRNEEYFRLKDAPEGTQENKLFKVLEVISKAHIKNQEGVSQDGKLYLDFPRFEKSNLELVQSGSMTGKVRESGSAVALAFRRIVDWFKGAKADAGGELNFKDEGMMIRSDAFSDQIEKIPIHGLYNLTKEETSTDIITSMYRYMYGAENQKQLIKMNPMAKGIQNILAASKNPLEKYVRRDAFNNLYEREFQSQTQTGPWKDTAWIHNVQKFVFKRASFAFFALNIPSALKNAMSAKFQAMIESAAGKYIDPSSLVRGEVWSAKYMIKLSSGDAYAKGQQSIEHQLVENFDPIEGRHQDKFGQSITRTMGKDMASMTWLYNFRKWTEIQAGVQTFAAMMYKHKIPMGDRTIDYMDAWELNADGKIQLKKGIDPKYGITYDDEGNVLVGSEYKMFRSQVHGMMNKLNGAYSKFSQPEMQRYMAFKFLSFLRRYFTTMAVNRFGKKRWNPGMGEIDEGYYISAVKTLAKLKSGNIHDLNIEDKRAWMKVMVEVGSLYLMSFLIGALWGWDPDDDDRFKKLRKRSGHAGLLGMTSDNKRGEEFDPMGFMSLHSLNLMMQIRSENEQFLPLPGYGIDNISTIIDLKSLAFGPTTDTYGQMSTDVADMWEGSNRQYYKRQAGPYEWQDKGGRKLWAHIAKSFGLTGGSIDPAMAVTNFQKAQNRNR